MLDFTITIENVLPLCPTCLCIHLLIHMNNCLNMSRYAFTLHRIGTEFQKTGERQEELAKGNKTITS